MARLFVLGAADPEMAAIEALLVASGERVVYATVNGVRCHPGNAYKANGVHRPDLAELHDLDRPAYMTPDWAHDADDSAGWDGCQPIEGIPFVMVECGFLPSTTFAAPMQRIDHHNPGDQGWGKTPAEYFEASSIGQVLSLLGQQVSQEAMLIAAADHCLDAAYRGQCPGVNPDELMEWRAASRAAFQRRDVADVICDIEAATVLLIEAATEWAEDVDQTGYVPTGTLPFADLRGQSIPELPEASARCGVPFLSDVSDRDGRKKCVLMGCGQHPELLANFMAGSMVPGLVDYYGGDASRGFAGGYYTA